MVKSRSKGASKGKRYTSKGKRYTRRRIKVGGTPNRSMRTGSMRTGSMRIDSMANKTPPTVGSIKSQVTGLIESNIGTNKSVGSYGFGSNTNSNSNRIVDIEGSNDDIDVDKYKATLFDTDRKISSKNISSKNLSLPKVETSVWDGRVDYLKQREQFIETQNKTIKDLNNKITNLKANNPEEEKLLQELSINFTQMTDMVNNRKDNVPQNEKKATENLSNMFRDQINFLYFYKNADQIIGQINKLRGITIKPPAKPWFNFTRKKVNKTGTQLLHKILRAATGANITQAGEIAELLKKSGEQITNDAIKKVWADMLNKQKEA